MHIMTIAILVVFKQLYFKIIEVISSHTDGRCLTCETNVTHSVMFFGVYRYRLRPRFLRDVSQVDTKVQLFGGEVAFPICVAPTGMHCMAHPDGETATARGSYIHDINQPYGGWLYIAGY